MAHLLIWGATRELVEGALVPSIQAETVASLAQLRAALGPGGLALVLADPACLEAERAAIETWLLEGGSGQAVIMAVADASDADQVLQRLPFVDDVVMRPLSSVRLRLKLARALETVQGRRVVRQLEDALARKNEDLRRKGQDLSELNNIGVKLSAERDTQKLLPLILTKSREITSADAGSLYLVERAEEGNGQRDRLRFRWAQNDTVDVPFEEFTMPLDESWLAGYTAVTGKVQNVPDAYELPSGSAGSRTFDERSGYRTKSMLVVPMRDHHGHVIGVLQLINKKRSRDAVLRPLSLVDEIVIPFTANDEELVSSLASQAAVAFENADLIQRIRKLFDEFILGAVAAVEMRDPTTEGHSRRVAVLTVGLARKVNEAGGPLAQVRLNQDQLEELRYAALLHDFGKVAVEEKYLKKSKKLYATEMIGIRQRFAYIAKAQETAYLRRRLEALESGRATAEQLAALAAEYEQRRADVERTLRAVLSANEPTVVEEENFRTIMNLPTRRFMNENGSFEEDHFPVEEWAQPPYLAADELEALTIRKGSLTNRERDKINEHVTHTYSFLRKIPWTGEFRRIPEIAWAHHEKLDGSGYPRGLKAVEIPTQSRMMTIADIYDALVAWDRPYKKSVNVERALDILSDEAKGGKLDSALLQVFIEARVYDDEDFKAQLKAKS
jgi:HD-GYP domain-containing protein (c-di-GMP phosphodiesterase class II)